MPKPLDRDPREPWARQVGLSLSAWSQVVWLRVRYRAMPAACPWCEGTGTFRTSSTPHRCSACDGTGTTTVWRTFSAGDGFEDDDSDDDAGPVWMQVPLGRYLQGLPVNQVDCPGCGGRGYLCDECERTGTVSAWHAATREMVTCLYCDGTRRVGHPMLDWDCTYCAMSGEIPLSRLQRLRWMVAGEDWHGWLGIWHLVHEGMQDAYPSARDELDPRIEAEPGVRWWGIDFSADDLTGLDLRDADLSRCSLPSLAGTLLAGADLTGARLPDDLAGMDFTGVTLDEVDFGARDLAGTHVELAASLDGASLARATGLTAAQRRACEEKGAIVDDEDA